MARPSRPPRPPRSSHRAKRPRHAPGTVPGSLHLSPDPTAKVDIRAMLYGPVDLYEEHLDSLAEFDALRPRGQTMWLDVVGLEATTLEALGQRFGLHPLALEDVASGQHRPKVEAYEDHLFIVLRAVHYTGDPDALTSHQVALFVGRDFVLTIREERHGQFQPVRERLRAARGRIRARGADYLGYALIDALVDHYLPVLDTFAVELDALADDLEGLSTERMLTQVTDARQALLRLGRMSLPMRDVIESLYRDQNLFSDETRIFLRDCVDHVLTLVDGVEQLSEQATYLMEVHMALVNHRLNEVMKVLTIMSTIFMPLSFVAGVYGMNFDASVSSLNMPELRWAFGYPFALGLMGFIAVGLLVFFRRKGWLTAGAASHRHRERIQPPPTRP
jgi:magnesium transporter